VIAELLLIVVCVLVSAVFSGVEAGLWSLNRVRLRTQRDRGDRAAVRLYDLVTRPTELFATVLLATSLANILALALATRLAVERLGDGGYWVVGLLGLPCFLMITELLPKAIFRRFPYRALAFFGGLLQVSRVLFLPVLWLMRRMGAFRESDRKGRRNIFVGRQEMKSAAREGERLGTVTAAERRLIHSVIDLGGVRLGDLMVPMDRVVSVAKGTSIEEAIALGMRSDVDRLPVRDADGAMVGLVHVLDLLYDKRADATVDHYLRRMVVAPAEESAFALLRRLRAARLSLATVVDRNGRPLGIVGSEDILDPLVRVVTSEP